MLRAGIVGLPNVGKSTLFNAITKTNVLAANYPFATIDPNVGVVFVEDDRLDVIRATHNSIRLVPTSFEFIDIAGLVKGASKGEGLGNQFLSHIREVDAICHVVRCFEDTNITHVENTVDPIRDVKTIETELALADLESVDRRIIRLEKRVKAGISEALVESDLLKKIKEALESEIDIKTLDINLQEEKLLRHFNLLSFKPTIYVANVSESDLLEPLSNKHYLNLLNYAKERSNEVVLISAEFEQQLLSLDKEDQVEYLNEYNLEKSTLNNLIQKAYTLLGLETFFTVGPNETRAWTFKKGMTASECAGLIHSDFERGFIRAETFSYDDLVKYQTTLKIKEHGRLRLEGRDYKVVDGDIIYFRFNV